VSVTDSRVGQDVLASRDPQFLSVWHWLGYRRFFAPNRWLPLTTYAQYTDMHESRKWIEDELGVRLG